MRFPPHRTPTLILWVVLLALGVSAFAEEEGEPAAKPDDSVATSMTQNIQGEGGIVVQTMCTNCNSADLSMGSFGNDFISMTCDGLPVPPGLAQIYLLSVVPPTVIDNVSVEKGAGRAAVDAGQVGGEIELRRREPAPGIQANATVDSGGDGWKGARADVSGRVGWFGGSLVASWAESDFVDADQDGNPDMSSIDRQTVEGRFDIRPGDRHRITLGASSYDETQNDGRAAYDYWGSQGLGRDVWERENVDLEREQYDLGYKASFRDGSNLTAGLLYADRTTLIEEEQGGASDIFRPTYDIHEEHSHARLGWFRPVGNRFVVRAGVSRTEQEYDILDVQYNQLRFWLPQDFRFDERLVEDGAWVESEVSLGSGVNLFVGLRRVEYTYEDNTVEAEGNSPFGDEWLALALPEGDDVLPRAVLTWKPVDPLSLRFSLGEGLRQPAPGFEEVCCGRRYRNNRGIRLESSRVFGVEAIYQPATTVQLSAALFQTDFDDLIVKVAGQVDSFVPVYQNANMPKASSDSLSFEARLDPAPWINVQASASWTETSNDTDGDVIPVLIDYYGMPQEVELTTEEIPYVPERSVAVSFQIRPPRTRIVLDLSAQHAGRQLIQEFSVFGAPPFIETPSFWIYNARVSRSFKWGFDAFFGVDNFSDYYQNDLADPRTDYTWGPLRGRYYYGGVSYRFASRFGR